jgi:hypothetical protein
MRAVAKTSERRKAEGSGRSSVGRQAADAVWSPSELLEALKKPSRARKQELLREVGILDKREDFETVSQLGKPGEPDVFLGNWRVARQDHAIGPWGPYGATQRHMVQH